MGLEAKEVVMEWNLVGIIYVGFVATFTAALFWWMAHNASRRDKIKASAQRKWFADSSENVRKIMEKFDRLQLETQIASQKVILDWHTEMRTKMNNWKTKDGKEPNWYLCPLLPTSPGNCKGERCMAWESYRHAEGWHQAWCSAFDKMDSNTLFFRKEHEDEASTDEGE